MKASPQVRSCEKHAACHLRLESIFREHAPRLVDYALHRGATLSEAEDVVSEVFVVLTRRLDVVPDAELPWLYGVARKVLHNQMRSRRRRLALYKRSEEQALGAGETWLPESSFAEGDVPVLRGLSRLSPDDREVLLLVAWDGLKYEEAAESLGCTRDAFAQRLSRARRRLLSQIEDIRTHEETVWAAVESKER
jgi:RNA polymerase sigma-70 factor (ECF subfamily)